MERITLQLRPMLARVALMRHDRALLHAVVLATGRGIAIVLQIVTIRAFTTLITPHEVGRYYLLLAAQTWATLLLLGPPMMYLQRHLLEWRAHNAHARAMAMFFGYTVAVAILVLPVFWFVIHLGFVSAASPIATAVVLVVWLVAATSMSVMGTLLNLMQRRGASVLVTSGGSVLALAGALTMVFGTGTRSAETWVAGLSIGTAIAAMIGAVWLVKGVVQTTTPESGDGSLGTASMLLRSVWHFSWPLALITSLYWIQSQGYRRILLMTAGESGVGQFAVAWSVGATIGIAVDQILQQWLLPPFFQRVAGKSVEEIDETWQQYFAAALRLLIPLGALTAALSPFLLRLLAGPTFQMHPLLPVWAGIAETFHVIGSLLYLGGIARRKTREMVVPHLPGAISVLLFLYPASLYFGLHGAGSAMMLSYIIFDVSMWLTVQRHIFARVSARDLTIPAIVSIAIVLVCVAAGLAGWRANLGLAALTTAIAALVFLAGALAALPRLLILTQPSADVVVPVEARSLEEVPCL